MARKAVTSLWHDAGVLLGGGICLNMGVIIGMFANVIVQLIALMAALGMLIASWVFRRRATQRAAEG
ncbi:MAG TPA: hypothetical protein PK400_02270 [Phycisphaerales bacterium]|nr:hypothetical protein [Phycisphaerales bacterium]HRQ76066.1 hypothetical protein [Phycisphaerales bacterium]